MTTPTLAGLSATDSLTVTATQIAEYRAAARSVIDVLPPDAFPVPGASPVHPFVLSSSVSERIVGTFTENAAGPVAAVHLSQEIRPYRPLQAGERVTVAVRVLAARPETRGVRLALRSEVTGADGQPIATLTTGALLHGATLPEPFGEMPAPHTPAVAAARQVTVTRVLTVESIRRYAAASGDHNPIHLDAAAAQAAGFPGLIAHGMSVAALVCEEVVDRYAGGDPDRVRGLGVRFSAPVLPDEPLEIVLRPDLDGQVVGFSARTPNGIAVKGGWIEIGERRAHG